MHRKTVKCVFIVLFVYLKAQGAKDSTWHNKARIGVVGSQDFIQYNFIHRDRYGFGIGNKAFLYKNITNYTFGVSGMYSFKKSSIGLNITYSEKGFQKTWNEEWIYGGEVSVKKNLYHIGFLQIQLMYDYALLGNKWFRWYAGVGQTTGFIYSESETLFWEDGKVEENKRFKITSVFPRNIFDASVTTAIEIKFLSWISFQAKPYLSYSFVIIDDYIIKKPSYTYGVLTSLIYTFK